MDVDSEKCHKHVKVFGCRAFAHITKDERSKLDGSLDLVFILETDNISLVQLVGSKS